jgi:hypothetical protein
MSSLPLNALLTAMQLKEEFENDPEFLKGYSVNKVAA